MSSIFDNFMINNKVCIITGGAGLLGRKQAEAVLEGNGLPVLLDISQTALDQSKACLKEKYPKSTIKTYKVDITNKESLEKIKDDLLSSYSHIDVLINNAANNPKIEGHDSKNMGSIRFHNLPISIWNEDMAVGLTGAFLCSQIFGYVMEMQESGVILNISSDYGIISPDQRVYQKEGLSEDSQIVKPVSYSVVKHGIIGLTKYLATYWAKKNIRVNTLCPASLSNGQDEVFIKKISQLIPMGRMSRPEEYVCTVLYMISDASSYMTGATVILDGGRTIW